jgi:hypothetical protein
MSCNFGSFTNVILFFCDIVQTKVKEPGDAT